MSLVINHNIPALSAYNEMAAINENLAKAIEKTSSGLRLNRAGDDAAGLAVSEKMQAQADGLAQASGNTQDGISLIQTAEGALSETHDILERMRELAVQSANGTLTQQDRAFVHEEVSRLREEVDRIANTAQYNKKKLLNGDAAARLTILAEGALLMPGSMSPSTAGISRPSEARGPRGSAADLKATTAATITSRASR